MSITTIALTTGIIVGLVVGALGAGGGIISVPALVYLLGVDPHAASAGALCIVGLTAITALIGAHRQGRVRWLDGIIFGVCTILAAVVGSRLSLGISDATLMGCFACLLLVVGAAMAVKGLRKAPEAPQCGRHERNVWRIAAAATVSGGLTGFFGVGGGFIVVPMLVFALGYGIRQAAGTSLVVMTITSAVSLLSRADSFGTVPWRTVFMFALASMAGAVVGARCARRAQPWVLTTMFGGLVLLIGGLSLAATLAGFH